MFDTLSPRKFFSYRGNLDYEIQSTFNPSTLQAKSKAEDLILCSSTLERPLRKQVCQGVEVEEKGKNEAKVKESCVPFSKLSLLIHRRYSITAVPKYKIRSRSFGSAKLPCSAT